MSNSKPLVSYIRVSTQRQGQSGLGIEAQQKAVEHFANSTGGVIVSQFVEIESGKKSMRPQLAAALDYCSQSAATLVIAKLDRLARNVHFVSGLLESNVQFYAADMPNADRFMLHVYAAVAEEEARRISERTKAALKAARERGVKLGTAGPALAAQTICRANAFAMEIAPRILQLRKLGFSVRQIAKCLNLDEVPSYSGGKWHPTTVQRLIKRINLISNGNPLSPPCQQQ